MNAPISLREHRARRAFAPHLGADVTARLVELLERGRLNDFGIWAATLQTGMRPDIARHVLGECGYLNRTQAAIDRGQGAR